MSETKFKAIANNGTEVMTDCNDQQENFGAGKLVEITELLVADVAQAIGKSEMTAREARELIVKAGCKYLNQCQNNIKMDETGKRYDLDVLRLSRSQWLKRRNPVKTDNSQMSDRLKKVSNWITAQFKAGKSQEEIEQALVDGGTTRDKLYDLNLLKRPQEKSDIPDVTFL